MLPTELPEELRKLEKNVDALIGGFIREMERLRDNHKQHIKKYLDSKMGGSTLRMKLAHKDPLVGVEATGEALHKLLQHINTPVKQTNPYSLL